MSQPTPDAILQTGLGFWPAKTLLSAIELGVFTELAGGAETLESLRTRLGLHPRSARDFFDALVALGFLSAHDGRYANTPATDLFLDRAQAVLRRRHPRDGQRAAVSVLGRPDRRRCKTGEPQNEIKHGGEGLFDDALRRSGAAEAVPRSDDRPEPRRQLAIARKFPWSELQDVRRRRHGAGRSAGRRSRSPTRTSAAQGFDLPAVGPIFDEYVASLGLSERLTFAPGRLLHRRRCPRADVVVMGHILHDWDLSRRRCCIVKAYDALPKGGALVVYESIIDDDRSKNAFGLLMSLNMLIETPGGFDYTGADCAGWMKEAGFRRHARRAPRRAGLDGRRHQVGASSAGRRAETRLMSGVRVWSARARARSS